MKQPRANRHRRSDARPQRRGRLADERGECLKPRGSAAVTAVERFTKTGAAHRFSGWAVSIPLGMLVLVLTLVPLQMLDEQGLPRCRSLQLEKQKLLERNARLSASLRELHAEVGALRDSPKAIERVARQELGLVRDDEVIFQFEGSLPRAHAPRSGDATTP